MIKAFNEWISPILEDKKVLFDLNISEGLRIVKKDYLCIVCRGVKLLCGKNRCPIMIKLYSFIKTKVLYIENFLEGCAPPDVFIGRIGYPKVYIGPLVPPIIGDTRIFSTPEKWVGRKIDEIIDMRSQLIRGKYLVDVHSPSKDLDKFSLMIQELSLSSSSINTELLFERKPSGAIVLSNEFEPFGPSAPIKSLKIGNYKTNKIIEKAYYDYDMKAEEAVMKAYLSNVNISAIQRAFSSGCFGLKKNRRFVPTRWSITAVDSIVSNNLIGEIKNFPIINEYQVYSFDNIGNRFVILMIPSKWKYESMEAWWPGTFWNPWKNVVIYGDREHFSGRTTYAEIGGCYYAARLAVTEKLYEMKKQAGVIIFREIYPEYILPIGVWNVRESVRASLKNKSMNFNNLKDALNYISSILKIPLKRWCEASTLLKEELYQTKILDFILYGH
ncbi:MAG: Nre family DNA repair protein [Nitrososphaerota archaeon]